MTKKWRSLTESHSFGSNLLTFLARVRGLVAMMFSATNEELSQQTARPLLLIHSGRNRRPDECPLL
jgi:hypothetical protein